MTYMMFDPKLLDGVKTVHFIGCGGSGTFPLIQILHARGYTITGSDVEETKNTEAERALGVQVTIGHDAANLGDAQLVVYSAAIHDDNPELKAARARGIKAVERSILLGYVSRMHSQTVGVAGTHGKTTTSGMITTMLELAGRDPAAVIGGKLPLIGGYGKAGSGPSAVRTRKQTTYRQYCANARPRMLYTMARPGSIPPAAPVHQHCTRSEASSMSSR